MDHNSELFIYIWTTVEHDGNGHSGLDVPEWRHSNFQPIAIAIGALLPALLHSVLYMQDNEDSDEVN